jgi:predicted nicotinamide N-methyase
MKQTRASRTAFGLNILNSNHPEIRRLKREGYAPSSHGNKFWNSSFLLMDHLERAPLARGARVMEVGCGWGLLGIYCARHFEARVTGIDADRDVFPFLDLHARNNGVAIASERIRYERLTKKRLSEFDVLLGADICFWDETTPILFNLIKRALDAGVKQIIISDPGRGPFLELLGRCGALENATVLARRIERPVRASGELLIIRQ